MIALPTLLALTGSALTAVAVFTPHRERPSNAAFTLPVFALRAPSLRIPARIATFRLPALRMSALRLPALGTRKVRAGAVTVSPLIAPVTWPSELGVEGASCDATTRVDLVLALIDLDSPWARTILAHASEEETDPAVRAAIASSNQSRVT